ncbi:alpha/beta hydrolase [Paenarthrobacter sp. NPDC057981]|uniref:alpha/beta hydrolase n=1 Tax=Paenarthrobacter sp. NPDC057981 TaxID=3346297 RepID=UPI0036DBCCEC
MSQESILIVPPPAPAFLSEVAATNAAQSSAPLPVSSLNGINEWEQHIDEFNAVIRTSIIDNLHRGNHDVTTARREINGVQAFVVTPDGVDEKGPVLFEVHGGGLVYCGGDITRAMSEVKASHTGWIHWATDYRMPPRYPFPVALDDLVSTYRALLEEREPERIVVGGESAGGNLAAALMLRLKQEGLPLPAGLLLLTPEVDLTESGDTFATLAHASPGLQSLMKINLLYAAGRDLSDPLISPLFGNLEGLPPTLLIAGTRDLFLSNTVRMHRALREAEVAADLHIFDARPHAGYGNAPEEEAVHQLIRDFLNERVPVTL